MKAKTAPSPAGVTEVRYSLKRLLEEIAVDRTVSTFAMEKLDQQEIGKLFKTKPRRAKRKK